MESDLQSEMEATQTEEVPDALQDDAEQHTRPTEMKNQLDTLPALATLNETLHIGTEATTHLGAKAENTTLNPRRACALLVLLLIGCLKGGSFVNRRPDFRISQLHTANNITAQMPIMFATQANKCFNVRSL